MSRRRLVLALSTVLVLAVAAGLYWFHVAGRVRKSVEAWSEDRRAAGWRVEYRDLSVGGPPWRPTARLEVPAITLPGGWRAEAATATVEVDPLGRGGEVHAISLRLTAGATMVAIAALALSVSSAPPELGFTVAADGIDPPQPAGLGLDPRITRLEVAGRVRGGVPKAATPAALAAWSADGGTVEIDRLALDWAPLALEADGTVTFDAGLQPLAAFAARVRGAAPLIDRLAANGRIEAGAALAAKTVLILLARPDSQGRPAVPVPVTIQDGQMWLGPARVAAVPPIRWPDGAGP